eukprot:1020539-Prymnesium_polylepis.1
MGDLEAQHCERRRERRGPRLALARHDDQRLLSRCAALDRGRRLLGQVARLCRPCRHQRRCRQ